jgi:hypothetical protein
VSTVSSYSTCNFELTSRHHTRSHITQHPSCCNANQDANASSSGLTITVTRLAKRTRIRERDTTSTLQDHQRENHQPSMLPLNWVLLLLAAATVVSGHAERPSTGSSSAGTMQDCSSLDTCANCLDIEGSCAWSLESEACMNECRGRGCIKLDIDDTTTTTTTEEVCTNFCPQNSILLPMKIPVRTVSGIAAPGRATIASTSVIPIQNMSMGARISRI